MAVKLEQKLTALEDEVIALKSTYTIYGGLVKSYMNTYSWTNNTGRIASLKVRFRPDYLRGEGKTLVFGFYYSATKNNVVEPLDNVDLADVRAEVIYLGKGDSENNYKEIETDIPIEEEVEYEED